MKLPANFIAPQAAALIKKSCGPAQDVVIADAKNNSYGVHTFSLCEQDELISGLVDYCGAKKLGEAANALKWPNVKNLTGSGNWLTAAGNVSSTFLGCALNGTQTEARVQNQESNWALNHELLPFVLVGIPCMMIFAFWGAKGFPIPQCNTRRRPTNEAYTMDRWPS